MIHGLAITSVLLALTACKDSKTAADAAAYCGISKKTLYRLVNEGSLKAVRIGHRRSLRFAQLLIAHGTGA